MDAGALNVPFLGNRALDLANQGKVNLERPQISAGAMDQIAQRSGRMEAMRLALSRARSGKFSPEEREGKKSDAPNPLQQSTRLMMNGFIRACWSTLWITLGHSVYLLDIVFIAGAGSSRLRQYVPAVGEEWFAPQMLQRLPKSAILPIKFGEICALAVLTGLIFLIDLILFAAIALIVTVIGSIVSHL